jgi:hypothetical protein
MKHAGKHCPAMVLIRQLAMCFLILHFCDDYLCLDSSAGFYQTAAKCISYFVMQLVEWAAKVSD